MAPEPAAYGNDCSFVDPGLGGGAYDYWHDCKYNGQLSQNPGADSSNAVTCGVAFETQYEVAGGAQFCTANCSALDAFKKNVQQQEAILSEFESALGAGSAFISGPESKGLLRFLERSGPEAGSLSFGSGREAEQLLEKNVGGTSQKLFDVPGFANRRRVDVFSDGIAFESKVGYVTADADTVSQIQRDAALLAAGGQVQDVVWVFGRSGTTGQLGPSKTVVDLLERNGIKYTTFDDFYPAG